VGTIAGIPGGAEGMAFGAAGGFVAGAGGYSADYYFNSDAFESQSISAALGYLDWRDSLLDGIPPDQFDRNYRTLPGKYQ